MANEITHISRIDIANGTHRDSIAPVPDLITQSAQGKFDSVVLITTSDAVIATGGLAASDYGVYFFQNLNGTNYVEIGATAAGAIAPLIKLAPGEHSTGRLMTGITLRGRANTASCLVRICIFKN